MVGYDMLLLGGLRLSLARPVMTWQAIAWFGTACCGGAGCGLARKGLHCGRNRHDTARRDTAVQGATRQGENSEACCSLSLSPHKERKGKHEENDTSE